VLTIPDGTIQSGDRIYVRYLLTYQRSGTPGVLFNPILYFGTDGASSAVSLIGGNTFTPANNDQGYGSVDITITTAGVVGLGSSFIVGDRYFSGPLQPTVQGGSGISIDTTVSPFLIQPAMEFDPLGGIPQAGDAVTFEYTEVTVVRPVP
jgi:hypothetical protein